MQDFVDVAVVAEDTTNGAATRVHAAAANAADCASAADAAESAGADADAVESGAAVDVDVADDAASPQLSRFADADS